MQYLPDVNLWLALAFEAHAHHLRAAAWFDSATAGSCVFSRHTQQGFLRLASNPSAFGPDTLTLAAAWTCYDALRADPRVTFAAEPPGIEAAWRGLTPGTTYSHRVWSDAYLAAFARVARLTVVSFDAGIDSGSGVDAVKP